MKKFPGAVLLVSGACIGAGMLALPMVMASLGLKNAILSLAGMWLLMCFTGLLVVEVNLWLPQNTSYVSMAKKTLGNRGKIFTWIIYVLLLYSVLSAYTTIGGNLLTALEIKYLGHGLPHWVSYGTWVFTFAAIVYAGMNLSETINRLLILGLLISFSAMAAIITPHINPFFLHNGHWRYALFSLPVVATAFGYHVIIPSLRNYLSSNKTLITLAVILGTLIPFCFYAYWIYLIFGVIPTKGEHGLLTILHAGKPTEVLTQMLTYMTQSPLLGFATHFFIFFAVTSSVIAVAIGLFDLFADGLKIKKTSTGRLILAVITFIPPLIYALVYPEGFILALGYAGIFVAILHGILPVMMVWTGRYHYWQGKTEYQVWGGRLSLIIVFLLSCLIIFSELGKNFHWIPME